MRQQQAAQTPITAVMHTHPYQVTAQQPVRELLALFVDQGISATPVVDEQGRPIGFVSKTDVVRQLHRSSPGERHESDTQNPALVGCGALSPADGRRDHDAYRVHLYAGDNRGRRDSGHGV